jgi:enamine deaminase RidA (YjgF/YER057c/UK114 family)
VSTDDQRAAEDPLVRFQEGSAWEQVAGYSRAVRLGQRIQVSGTTGHLDADGGAPGDTYAQTARALDRALGAVRALGGERAVVVRSRIYLTPQARWEDAARAHAERLGRLAPANTMLFVHALIGDELLVEVELEAEVIGDAVQPPGQQRPADS